MYRCIYVCRQIPFSVSLKVSIAVLFCILFLSLKLAISEVKGNRIIISDPWPENSYCNEQSASVPKVSEAQDAFLKYLLCQSKCHFFFWAFYSKRSETLSASVSCFVLVWVTLGKSQQLEEGRGEVFFVLWSEEASLSIDSICMSK